MASATMYFIFVAAKIILFLNIFFFFFFFFKKKKNNDLGAASGIGKAIVTRLVKEG
jgi:hypothetical protein